MPPAVYVLACNVDRYGHKAILGRDTLAASEIVCFNEARYMVQVWNSREQYRDKNGAPNWSEWSTHNRAAGKYLAALELELNEDA